MVSIIKIGKRKMGNFVLRAKFQVRITNILSNPNPQILNNIYSVCLNFIYPSKELTPPIAEIICVKNVWAIVVCGFFIK